MNEISESAFQRFYCELKKDKFTRIRAAVLHKAVVVFPNQSIIELEAALFDKSETVRSLARYLLSKKNITDFASYYTEAIMKQSVGNLRGALLGIGETGGKVHTELVLPLVKWDEAGIIKAAARALAMLDPDPNREVFISLLSHDHPGVSKEAGRSLQAARYEDKAEDLYRIYKEAEAPHSRYQAAVLLCSLSKWVSIRYIPELYVNEENHAISRLGQQQASKWLAGYNRSFSVPSKEQAVSVRTALSKYGSGLRKWEREQLEFCLKGF
ncbi:HEAT repeat domain-containing protein [Metabacillus sp. 84]|uniref:HEAT repeat domain-containing protein n=1 Tax=unclassified Metabacillus TaxID=2675274 RepID=UPI003CF29F33